MCTPNISEIYQTESRRVLATLSKLLGDFDLAEEAIHDAFTTAAESWPRHGLPSHLAPLLRSALNPSRLIEYLPQLL